MSIAEQTLDPFRRGNSYIFEATVTDENGAVNLTAYSIWSTGKYALSDADAAAVWQVTKAGGGITVTGASSNIARVVVPASATSAFTGNQTLWWDVQIKSGDLVYTVAMGRVAVYLDVTQTS